MYVEVTTSVLASSLAYINQLKKTQGMWLAK
jgi:hypothetical protein